MNKYLSYDYNTCRFNIKQQLNPSPGDVLLPTTPDTDIYAAFMGNDSNNMKLDSRVGNDVQNVYNQFLQNKGLSNWRIYFVETLFQKKPNTVADSITESFKKDAYKITYHIYNIVIDNRINATFIIAKISCVYLSQQQQQKQKKRSDFTQPPMQSNQQEKKILFWFFGIPIYEESEYVEVQTVRWSRNIYDLSTEFIWFIQFIVIISIVIFILQIFYKLNYV